LGTALVNAMSLQPDGKLLIGGDLFFHRRRPLHDVGRLYADGTPIPRSIQDPSFTRWRTKECWPSASNPTQGPFWRLRLPRPGRAVGPDWPDSTPMARSTTFLADLDGASVRCHRRPSGRHFLAGGHGFSAPPTSASPGLTSTDRRTPISSDDQRRIRGRHTVDGSDRILVGGKFGQADGETRFNLARLHRNGSLDPGFAPVIADAQTSGSCHQVQNDGKS